jgi:uncharacterized membrane protein YwzB
VELQIVQTAYWVALSTWFGSTLFVCLCAPAILREVREADPTLPRVLSVNLDAQHSALLGGNIVAALLRLLHIIGVVCASVLLAAFVLQFILLRPVGQARIESVLRAILFLGCVGVFLFDWLYISRKVAYYRSHYIEHADQPDIANASLDQFNGYSRASATLLMITVVMLLGVILFSGNLGIAQQLLLP